MIMTTWHEEESLADATEFAVISAAPAGRYVAGCDAVVLAIVDNDAWRVEAEEAALTLVG